MPNTFLYSYVLISLLQQSQIAIYTCSFTILFTTPCGFTHNLLNEHNSQMLHAMDLKL